MTPIADTIELRTGGSGRSGFVPLAFSLLVIVSVLPAHPGASTLAILGALLALAYGLFWPQGARNRNRGRLCLFADGAAWFPTGADGIEVELHEHAWISRWLCVLTLTEQVSGHRLHLVVRRSGNPPQAYRALLVRLRLAGRHDVPRVLS